MRRASLQQLFFVILLLLVISFPSALATEQAPGTVRFQGYSIPENQVNSFLRVPSCGSVNRNCWRIVNNQVIVHGQLAGTRVNNVLNNPALLGDGVTRDAVGLHLGGTTYLSSEQGFRLRNGNLEQINPETSSYETVPGMTGLSRQGTISDLSVNADGVAVVEFSDGSVNYGGIAFSSESYDSVQQYLGFDTQVNLGGDQGNSIRFPVGEGTGDIFSIDSPDGSSTLVVSVPTSTPGELDQGQSFTETRSANGIITRQTLDQEALGVANYRFPDELSHLDGQYLQRSNGILDAGPGQQVRIEQQGGQTIVSSGFSQGSSDPTQQTFITTNSQGQVSSQNTRTYSYSSGDQRIETESGYELFGGSQVHYSNNYQYDSNGEFVRNTRWIYDGQGNIIGSYEGESQGPLSEVFSQATFTDGEVYGQVASPSDLTGGEDGSIDFAQGTTYRHSDLSRWQRQATNGQLELNDAGEIVDRQGNPVTACAGISTVGDCASQLSSQEAMGNRVRSEAGNRFLEEQGGYSGLISNALGRFGSGAAISDLLFGEAYSRETLTRIDRWFSGFVLSENYIESAVCLAITEHPVDVQDADYAFIETSSGTFQAIASVQAEKSAQIPLLCTLDSDGQESCPQNLDCRSDSFCYANGADEASLGQFYHITWGVAAPSDETQTPYLDENGVAITYNIVVCNSQGTFDCSSAETTVRAPLYSFQGNTVDPLRLENGVRDQATYMAWSINDYDTVCIDWTNPPITVSYQSGVAPQGANRRLPGQAGSSATNHQGARGGVFLNDLCVPIAQTEKGIVEIPANALSSGTVTASDISMSSGDEETSELSI